MRGFVFLLVNNIRYFVVFCLGNVLHLAVHFLSKSVRILPDTQL